MQFFLYLIVGGLSFFVDIAAFVALRALAFQVIPASITSFILATIANYLLSILLAFERGRFRRHVEIVRFLAVVLVGLGLNTLLVWCFVYPLSIYPTFAKIIAVPIVLVWNYLARRLLVFDSRIPAATRSRLGSTFLRSGSKQHSKQHCTVQGTPSSRGGHPVQHANGTIIGKPAQGSR
jgi:putative flippase GtrA